VNINLGGKCYEFLDVAYQKYQDLVVLRELELFKMQIDAIGESNMFVPITFSGSSVDIKRIIDSYDINVTDNQTLGDLNTQVDKMIIKGVVSNAILEQIASNISENNIGATVNSMPKFGILPNSGISTSESAAISNSTHQFMTNGIKKIIQEKDGVQETECRSTIIYND
jgi:hypothetical protein